MTAHRETKANGATLADLVATHNEDLAAAIAPLNKPIIMTMLTTWQSKTTVPRVAQFRSKT
jgi:hypothetical protein